MNSEAENSMSQGDHADSSSKNKSQQPKDLERKKSDYKADSGQKGSGIGEPRIDKQNQYRDKDKDKEDMAPARHPDVQGNVPKEFTKKDSTSYTEKSDRV